MTSNPRLSERVCSECGCDRWIVRDAQHTHDRLAQKTRDAEKLARENGLLRYQRDAARDEVAEVQSRLQRKIVKQARVIRRFEERWRAQGKPPYDGMGSDTAPGAGFDAAMVLPGEETTS